MITLGPFIYCTKNEVTFTEEILNGKLHFLYSDIRIILNVELA